MTEWLSGEAVVSEDAIQALDKIEQEAGRRWRASFDAQREKLSEAIDRAVEDDGALAAQQLATAAGIAYDKLVPPAQAGQLGAPVISQRAA